MSSRDRASLAWLAVGLWSLVVAVLLVVPGDGLPEVGPTWLDKVVHALLFAVHYLLLARALAPARAVGLAAALGSGLYAGLLEAVQIAVPGREWDWLDVAAGLAGIGLAAAFATWRRARLASPS